MEEGIKRLARDIFYKSLLDYEEHHRELAHLRDNEYKSNFEGISDQEKKLLIIHTVERINQMLDICLFLEGKWVEDIVEWDAKATKRKLIEYCKKNYGEIDTMIDTLKKKGILGRWYSIKTKEGYVSQCGLYGKVYIVDYPVYRTEGYCNRVSARLIRNGIPNKIIRQI